MRAFGQHDTSLVAGLLVGTVIIFHQPLRQFLEIAREIETRYHLDLLPALTVLTIVFVFHQHRKRQETKAEARAAAAEARQSHQRALELERLVTCGQALANALDLAALQRVLWRHLPKFVPQHEVWILVRDQDGELDANALIGKADEALYRAKRKGRNCLRLAPARPAAAIPEAPASLALAI